jgi:hypothetical protein
MTGPNKHTDAVCILPRWTHGRALAEPSPAIWIVLGNTKEQRKGRPMSGPARYFRKTLLVHVLKNDRQHWDLLPAHSVQGVRIQTQNLQNGRRHLLVQHRCLDLLPGPSFPRQQQSNVKIILIQPAVLSDLGASGEDDAGVGLENNVRGALIAQRTVEFVLSELPAKIS